MARRSDHSREELAGLVVSAAAAIVASEGARSLTMRGIATSIGYAAGSIYNAVGDLDQVQLRVNATTLTQLGTCLEHALHDRGALLQPIERAVLLAETYMGFVTANRHLWAALLEHPPSPGAEVPDWYAEPRGRLVDVVATALEPFYPDALSRHRAVIALWAALQGVASLAAGGNLAFALKDLDANDIARSLVLRYLTGTETRLS